MEIISPIPNLETDTQTPAEVHHSWVTKMAIYGSGLPFSVAATINAFNAGFQFSNMELPVKVAQAVLSNGITPDALVEVGKFMSHSPSEIVTLATVTSLAVQAAICWGMGAALPLLIEKEIEETTDE